MLKGPRHLRRALFGALVYLASLHTTVAGTAPTIGGDPDTSATVGAVYAFKPNASDGDGDTLRFGIDGKPGWASFDPATGRLWGTPGSAGVYDGIRIRVTDGDTSRALEPFAITVRPGKANYGHYFATRYDDTPADAAMLCGQAGVTGVVWRETWNEVEPTPGEYDFSGFDRVLRAIAGSHNPQCQLWIMVEFKSFNSSPVRNPCPAHLQARYSGPNADGSRAATCFMWEPAVLRAYLEMMRAAAARYDGNPRIEGFIIQESALGFTGPYSQDVRDGGTYTAVAWRDALQDMVRTCGAAFARSRCMAFLNFIRNGQEHLADVARTIADLPGERGCLSGPDVLPDAEPLYANNDAIYEVLVRHRGCRANSVQNASYGVANFGLDSVFQFAVRGDFGDFDQHTPRLSGLCVNSYLFWNHRVGDSWTGLSWLDALPVIAARPYGREWHDRCPGGGGPP